MPLSLFVPSPRLLVSTSLILFAAFLQTQIAFSQGELADASEQRTFVSDGSPVSLPSLGVRITPPIGWEVMTKSNQLSVVMQEILPKEAKPDYSKPVFQKNITVAAMHRSSPIDEKRALELRSELTRTFSADVSVKEYTVIEHKFFNYKGTNDGLLIYSSLMLGEFKMMQMNILVSGQEKQFLLTYTDLADSFAAGGPKYEQAWNSMVSIDVTGIAPDRYTDMIRYGSLASGMLLLFSTLAILWRRSSKRRFEQTMNEFENYEPASDTPSVSVMATLAEGWRLTSHGTLEDDGAFEQKGEWKAVSCVEEVTEAAPRSSAPRSTLSQPTSFVSQFG